MKIIILIVSFLALSVQFSCTDMVEDVKTANSSDRDVMVWDSSNWDSSEWGE